MQTLEECDEIQSDMSNLKVDDTDIGELENELEDLLKETKPEKPEVKEIAADKKPMIYPKLEDNLDDDALNDMLSKLPKIPEKLSPKKQEIEQKISN